VKNIIATISALATRTLREDVGVRQYVEAFQGRLHGMAATHDLLSRANWHGASLGELIEAALRSHVALDSTLIGMQGPEVTMAPNAAATLGMVFYELATNAVKYGALTVKGGHLDIAWQIAGSTPTDRLLLTWTESGGKTAATDMGRGFGVGFVMRSIEYELQGKAAMEPTPGGLRWTLEFPVPLNVQRN